MHVEGVDVGRGEEPDLGRFVAGPHLAADDPAGEADRELLAYFTVVVGEDVSRVGVDANDAGWSSLAERPNAHDQQGLRKPVSKPDRDELYPPGPSAAGLGDGTKLFDHWR